MSCIKAVCLVCRSTKLQICSIFAETGNFTNYPDVLVFLTLVHFKDHRFFLAVDQKQWLSEKISSNRYVSCRHNNQKIKTSIAGGMVGNLFQISNVQFLFSDIHHSIEDFKNAYEISFNYLRNSSVSIYNIYISSVFRVCLSLQVKSWFYWFDQIFIPLKSNFSARGNKEYVSPSGKFDREFHNGRTQNDRATGSSRPNTVHHSWRSSRRRNDYLRRCARRQM